jgi:hypothetical protein
MKLQEDGGKGNQDEQTTDLRARFLPQKVEDASHRRTVHESGVYAGKKVS